MQLSDTNEREQYEIDKTLFEWHEFSILYRVFFIIKALSLCDNLGGIFANITQG